MSDPAASVAPFYDKFISMLILKKRKISNLPWFWPSYSNDPENIVQWHPGRHRAFSPWYNNHLVSHTQQSMGWYLLELSPSHKIFYLPDSSDCIFVRSWQTGKMTDRDLWNTFVIILFHSKQFGKVFIAAKNTVVIK